MALNRHFRRHFVLVCARNSAISGGGYHQARMILVKTGLAAGGEPLPGAEAAGQRDGETARRRVVYLARLAARSWMRP
jgi:hypothetical protein